MDTLMRRNKSSCVAPAQTESAEQRHRRIVTWTPQEDEILREEVRTNGTERWKSIASRFKDKTSRQCRRRWFTYLNSECKKGSWTEEEDIILCEAQKFFGNRWTEIAKVVSGRTDNAVKNRFSTLCKKRAKLEAFSKENNYDFVNTNNERVITQDRLVTDGTLELSAPVKKLRAAFPDLTTDSNVKAHLGDCVIEKQMHIRPPLAVLAQNLNVENVPTQQDMIGHYGLAMGDVSTIKAQGMFLKKDDPKITALMQQAELLSSLAQKVNTEKTSQSIENAWTELHDFLIQSEESEQMRCKILEMDFLLKDFKESIDDVTSSNTGSWQSLRRVDSQDDSQGSSEFSSGSANKWHPTSELVERQDGEQCKVLNSAGIVMHITNRPENPADGSREGSCTDASIVQASVLSSFDGQRGDTIITDRLVKTSSFWMHTTDRPENLGVGSQEEFCANTGIIQAKILSSSDPRRDDAIIADRSNTEFGSPPQMVPFFHTFGEGIPSPKFTDSERHFLLSTLGLASPANANNNPSCRRALLQ